MKFEQQVCSLELAKRLKEMGVRQDSIFWWVNGHGLMELHTHKTDDDSCSAFTVAELGQMLPQVIKAKGRHDSEDRMYYLTPSAGGNGLRFIDYVAYHNGIGTMLAAYPYIEGATEADARAKMLVYLIENNIITPHKDTV